MQDIDFHAITSDRLSLPLFNEKKVEAAVLRLDKIHPLVSGNKWFKLRFYLEEARSLGKKNILTFGGAWSNHILATAAAGRTAGFNCSAIIRGEEESERSPVLQQAKQQGMRLFFSSRENYRQKKIPQELESNDFYVIAEGGYGLPGAAGAATILDHCDKENFTHFCCATGTGTMQAGLVIGAAATQQVIGISVLKNNEEIEKNIASLASNGKAAFLVLHDYHFGGYAKQKPELISFMNEFYRQTKIPSDFVYTGKLFYAIHDLVKNNFFPAGSKLLLIHSGGLPGNQSLDKASLIF